MESFWARIVNKFIDVKAINSRNEEIFVPWNPGFTKQAPLTPYPPKIDVEILTAAQHGGRIPKWMDKDGTLWDSHVLDGLFKSTDYGTTWTKVANSPDTTVSATSLMISDTGRVLWGTGLNWFFFSDEAKATWTKITMASGSCNEGYGHFKYKNILLQASYGDKTVLPSPKQVYASFDHGATFNLIYDGGDMIGYHIHDVAYDPWSDRIYISEGDQDRREIVYSDDRGATWKRVFGTYGFNGIQPTAIIPTAHGILFGSDQNPDGIYYLPRPRSPLQFSPKPENIVRDYFTFDNAPVVKVLFRRGWYSIEHDSAPTFLFSASPVPGDVNAGFPRILASIDGLIFHEIWKDKATNNFTLFTIVGPHKDDPEKRFWAKLQLQSNNEYHLLKGKFPNFY